MVNVLRTILGVGSRYGEVSVAEAGLHVMKRFREFHLVHSFDLKSINCTMFIII